MGENKMTRKQLLFSSFTLFLILPEIYILLFGPREIILDRMPQALFAAILYYFAYPPVYKWTNRMINRLKA